MKKLEKIINKYKYGRYEASDGNIWSVFHCYGDTMLNEIKEWHKKEISKLKETKYGK